jgi:hypothetical protein
MKKLLFAFATLAILSTSCKEDEPVETVAPLGEFIVGTWNFDDVALNGNIQTPLFSGELVGTASNVSGVWDLKADGTLSGQMKYDLAISLGGFPFGNEQVDESVVGTYTVKDENTLTVTMDSVTSDYQVQSRTSNTLVLVSTEEVNEDGSTGTITTRVNLSK